MMESTRMRDAFYRFLVVVFVFGGSTSAVVSSESGYFWHVTDIHYDPTYWTSQLSCNDEVSNPGPFGDYWCDSNWRLVEDTISNMAAIKPDVDFVIWTGDTVAHIDDVNISLPFNLATLQNITDAFRTHFGEDVPFVPSLGNHDFYPGNQADVRNDAMYNGTAEIWKQWIHDQGGNSPEDEVWQFMQGGFYSMSLTTKLRLIALNTNLYYTENHITGNMADPAGQFKWLEKRLETCRKDREKVIITAHVAPGLQIPDFHANMYPAHQTRFVSILMSYSDVILATHYGHEHSDGFRIIQDKHDASKAVVQFMAPSVTPWRFRAGRLVGNPHNPGIRLVEYQRSTGHHLNYVQFYINLTETNSRNQSNWSKLYDFRETYKVKDMSVTSLRQIFDAMMDEDKGMTLTQSYCNNALVSKMEKACSERTHYEIICAGLHYDLGDAKKCLQGFLIGGASSSLQMNFACIIISIFMFISVLKM